MKTKTPKKPTPVQPAKRSLRAPALLAGSVALLSGVVWAVLWAVSPPPPAIPQSAAPVQVAALVPTLSPELFTDKAREAYQIAKEIPEVLQHMPCFCGCPVTQGHKNNLYCFSDKHGAECDMCQNIAIEAKELHLQGNSIEKIASLIRAKFDIKPGDSH